MSDPSVPAVGFPSAPNLHRPPQSRRLTRRLRPLPTEKVFLPSRLRPSCKWGWDGHKEWCKSGKLSTPIKIDRTVVKASRNKGCNFRLSLRRSSVLTRNLRTSSTLPRTPSFSSLKSSLGRFLPTPFRTGRTSFDQLEAVHRNCKSHPTYS